MSWHSLSAFALLLSVALVVAGCTLAPAPGAATGDTLPSWVRVVPSEHDGRTPFVGGVSFAPDLESGLDSALADAQSQVELAARQRFIDQFNTTVSRSGVETTPVERLEYKNRVQEAYGTVMRDSAVQDSVYYQMCGGAQGSGAQAEAPVCRVFVMVSVGVDDWKTKLGEVLAVEKRRQTEEGAENLAEFTEYLMRLVLEGRVQGVRERRE